MAAMLSINDDDQRYIDELAGYVAIPSVSRDASSEVMAQAARWLVDQLAFADGRVEATQGHPVVRGAWLGDPTKPTILVYGHYDVQPTDPIDEWLSPPFEPAERNGNIYARGAADDKGQVWAQVKALESLMAANKALPLNVRVL
ncbi:MAG TPA: M20/M25/M40 family metallo-hydrolase, partial [Acidimicrobiales bacterium]